MRYDDAGAERREVAHFVSWCVERYKTVHGLTGAQAARELSEHDVLRFLRECYDIEHTLADDQMIDDMDVMTGRASRNLYGVVSR